MFKQYAFDLPTEIADEVIPQFSQAGFYFESIVLAEVTRFAVIAQSDREAYTLFTSALSSAGCLPVESRKSR